ncbi:hypothetical protein JTT01_05610 [Clostridium botulinum]|nr:hypothetical protein [Clostridium botulinum]MCS4522340.1 hypothetical protein [Clostridium botulinum]
MYSPETFLKLSVKERENKGLRALDLSKVEPIRKEQLEKITI